MSLAGGGAGAAVVVEAAAVKEWSLVGSQRTQVVGVGVSIEAVALLREGFVKGALLSLQPVKASPFQVMASQAVTQLLLLVRTLVLVLVLVVNFVMAVVELGQ